MKEFKRIQTENKELKTLQDNLISYFTNFKQSATILDGILLESIKLTSGSNEVSHKLNRTVRGYFVVSKSADVSIYDTGKNDKSLILNSSGDATVALWVF